MRCRNARWKLSDRAFAPAIKGKLKLELQPFLFPDARIGENRLVYFFGLLETAGMGEIVKFVHNGAGKITPQILKGIHKKLPMLKLEFTELRDPRYPHLTDQLGFLANVIEDFAEGEADEIPFVTVANAAFALVYAHRQTDLIPDNIPEFGHADDSAVVRAVLIEHEKVLADYAEKNGKLWSAITVEP